MDYTPVEVCEDDPEDEDKTCEWCSKCEGDNHINMDNWTMHPDGCKHWICSECLDRVTDNW